MNDQKEVDFLIVGQGLAGTLLAHFLEQNGASFCIFDDENAHSSSQIAAGLINPITGRRFVKSWMMDELLPFAKETYHHIEKILDIKLYYQHNIVRALFSAGEENDWFARSAIPEYAPYIQDPADIADFLPYVHPTYSYSEINHSARIHIALMQRRYKMRFQEKKQWVQEIFEHQLLKYTDEGIEYKQWKAKKIIFCEGAKAKENPFFNYLPFMCDKGEILLVKIPNVKFDKIYKHKVYLIPYEADTYWVGASVRWDYTNDLPTEEGKKELIEKLEKAITVPYAIIDHQAAIRPTVRDRRPFIGQHPRHKSLFLFNGFGTKGTSLAPYWAAHFVRHLLNDQPLSKEISISRYERFYPGVR